MASFEIQGGYERGISASTVIDVQDFLDTTEYDGERSGPKKRVFRESLINKAWRAFAWLLSICVTWLAKLCVRKKEVRPVELPIGFEPHRATTDEEIDKLLDTLGKHKKAWLEWMPVVLALKELEESMKQGAQVKPIALKKRKADGQEQYVADVFPAGIFSMLFPQVKGEIWMKPGMEASQGRIYEAKESVAKGHRRKIPGAPEGKVALVLGSSHQLSALILDILHKLFVEDEVVMLKLNPVNEFLGQYVAASLKPLILRGFVGICYGTRPQGIAMCWHPLIHSVRVTGSEDTYNAIVRGRSEISRIGSPPLNKPVMVELGNVSPIIVVPGKWSQEDLDRHVETVAAALSYNSGHCSTGAEVLVMDKTWDQRTEFIHKLRQKLKTLPQRVGWYPKSKQKQHGLQRTFPDIEELGIFHSNANVSTLPFLLVTGQTPAESSTRMETWTTALQEVMLDNYIGTASSFLKSAVQFTNESCFGALSCTILLDPRTRRQLGSKFENVLSQLKYGNIVVNAPGRMGFAISAISWGGYPGTLPRSIGSAKIASEHNSLMFDHPQKSILQFPFRPPHPALWSPTLANTEEVVEKALAFIDSPSISKSCAFYTALCRG